MSARVSRLDSREPKWWAAQHDFAAKHSLSDEANDALLELIYNAIEEDSGAMLGAKGGKLGGVARAVKMTPHERSVAASKAARARWGRTR